MLTDTNKGIMETQTFAQTDIDSTTTTKPVVTDGASNSLTVPGQTNENMTSTPEKKNVVSKLGNGAPTLKGFRSKTKTPYQPKQIEKRPFVKKIVDQKARDPDFRSGADERPHVFDAREVSVAEDTNGYTFQISRKLTVEAPREDVKKIANDYTILYHVYNLDKSLLEELENFAPKIIGKVKFTNHSKALNMVEGVRRTTQIDKETDREIAENSCNFKTSTIWSIHQDYQPDKRFVFDLNPIFRELTSMTWFRDIYHTCDHYMRENSTCPIKKLDTWQFIPRDWIDLHFNKAILCSRNVQPYIVDSLIACISNQKHGKKQYPKLVSILTTVQMMASKHKYNSPQQYIKLFWTTAFCIAASTEKIRPNYYTAHNLLEDLAKIVKIIPYAFERLGKTSQENSILMCSEFPFESNLSSADISAIKVRADYEFGTLDDSLVSKREFVFLKQLADGEETDAEISDVCNLFERGLFRLINPNRRIHSCSMPRKILHMMSSHGDRHVEGGRAKMIYRLVCHMLETESVDQAVSRLLANPPKDVTKSEYLEFVRAYSRLLFFDRRQKGLSQEWTKFLAVMKDPKEAEHFAETIVKLGTTQERSILVDQSMAVIVGRNILLIMSGQVEGWFKLLYNIDHNDMSFKHITSLGELVVLMPKVTNLDDDEIVSSDDDQEQPQTSAFSRMPPVKMDVSEEEPELPPRPTGIWSSIKDTIGMPFKTMEKHMETCDDIQKGMAEIQGQVHDLFERSNMRVLAPVIKEIDFSSISSGVESVKLLINKFFETIVEQVVKLFGIEAAHIEIDAVILLFYYFVWENTDNKLIKIWIVFDVLARCKLLDAVVKILTMFWKYIKSKLTTTSLEDFMNDVQVEIEHKKVEEAEAAKNCIKDPQPPEPEAEFNIETIVEALKSGTPAILAGLAVAITGYLGYKATGDDIGKKIVQTMRNIGFLGLGIATLPKIFTHVMAVINWSIDHIKGLINSEHQTKDDLVREVNAWCAQTACFHPGFTERVMAKDLKTCLQHQLLCTKALNLQTKIDQVTDSATRMNFRECSKRMFSLLPMSNNFTDVITGIDEPLHIAFAGDPGIGKTDLSKSIINEIGPTLTNVPEHPYPMNTALSYMDNYYGQQIALIDEDGVFTDPEKDAVMQRMQMLGGNPTLCNMASLDSKGRVMRFKLVVSNTNNAFCPIKNMLNMDSWNRRRILVKVFLREDCSDSIPGKEMRAINQSKITALGLDRNKSQHLYFCLADSLIEGKYLIVEPNGTPTHLDYKELVQVLLKLAEKHIITESTRAKTSGVDFSILRNAINRLTEIQRESKADAAALVGMMAAQLAMYNEAMQEDILTKKMRKAMRIETTSSRQELEDQGAVYFDLVSVQTGYTIVKSLNPKNNGYINEPIDMAKLLINERELVYTGTLTEEQKPTAKYWLTRLAACDTDNEAVKIRNLALKEEGLLPIYESWRQKVRDVLRQCANATAGFLKMVARRVTQVLGMGFAIGTITAVSIIGFFYSLNAFIFLITPKPKPTASYSGKEPKLKTVSQTHYSSILTLAEASVYEVVIDNGIGAVTCQATAIQGQAFLINEHSARAIKEGSKIWVYDPVTSQNNKDYKPPVFRVDPSDVVEIPGCDAAILVIRQFRPTKTILKHFVTEADLGENCNNFSDFDGVIVSSRGGRTTFSERQNLTTTTYGDAREGKVDSRRRNIAINSPVEGGTSGALLVHMNTKIPRAFLGIMMSSNDFQSYALIITQEMLLQAIGAVKPVYLYRVHEPDLRKLEKHPLKEVIYGLDTYESNQRDQSISLDCEFKKTPIYGTFPVNSQPAIVNPKDPRCEGLNHPYHVALSKYVMNPLQLESKEYEAGTSAIAKLYGEIPNVNTVRVYSTLEAIKGTRSQGSTSLDTTTSPGLPYKDRTTMKGKTEFIRHNPATDSWDISDIVYNDVDYYEKSYCDLSIPLNYKCEFVKHELVGQQKILNPKTRTVGTGNMIHLIIYRKCTSDLFRLEKLHTQGRNHCAIGVNPESKDWDYITKNLEFLNNVIAIDVKSWESIVDLSLLRAVTEAKVQVIENAYRRRGEKLQYDVRRIMHAIAVDYTDAYVCFTNIIFRKRHGMLSGHPGTLPENSDIHALLLFTIWCRQMRAKSLPGLATYDAWRHHMRIIVAGDDCLIALSQKGRSLMSVDDLVKHYNQIGVTVTAADKSETFKFEYIEDVEFLKMGFRLTSPGYVMYPNQSIYQQLFNWVRKGKMPYLQQFRTNMLTAMRFAFFRGKPEYDEIYRKLNDALAQTSQQPFTIEFEEMAAIIGREVEHHRVGNTDNTVNIMAEEAYDERTLPSLTN